MHHKAISDYDFYHCVLVFLLLYVQFKVSFLCDNFIFANDSVFDMYCFFKICLANSGFRVRWCFFVTKWFLQMIQYFLFLYAIFAI